MNAKATRMLFTAVALSALAVVLAGSAQARIAEGNGTQPPSRTVVHEQQTPPGSGTFYLFTPDPKIYAVYGALTSPTVANERQAGQGSRKLVTDAEICAALGRVRIEIQGCSHVAPLTAKQIQTGTGQARLKTLADGYDRLNS